jgi:hypothetical protein
MVAISEGHHGAQARTAWRAGVDTMARMRSHDAAQE